jgi:hypothetical protein
MSDARDEKMQRGRHPVEEAQNGLTRGLGL